MHRCAQPHKGTILKTDRECEQRGTNNEVHTSGPYTVCQGDIGNVNSVVQITKYIPVVMMYTVYQVDRDCEQ